MHATNDKMTHKMNEMKDRNMEALSVGGVSSLQDFFPPKSFPFWAMLNFFVMVQLFIPPFIAYYKSGKIKFV